MRYELNIQPEPFETDWEFDEASESFDTELADLEWEEEAGRRRRPRPAASRARRGGRVASTKRPTKRLIKSRFRPPIRPPRPPIRPPRPVIFPTFPLPVVSVAEPRPPQPAAPAGAEPTGAAPAPAGGPPTAPSAEPSEEGSEYVRWVQSSLNRILGLRLPLNGIMRPETRSAIRSFQQQKGLPVDGVVGPDTEQALRAAAPGQLLQPDDVPQPEPHGLAALDTELTDLEVEGEVDRASRDYARWIQQSLNQIMRLQLAVDGIIGPMTRSAIRDFQRRAGVVVDGVVGPLTEQALLQAGASNPPGTSPTPVLPPTPPVQPPTSTQALRNNIVTIALQERARWGNGTITECESRIRAVLEDYWRTGVGWVPSGSNWCSGSPWSGAFISWVMRKARAGSAFKYSSAHTDYVGAAKLNRLANNSNPYKAYRITEVPPRVGDLVCVERQDENGNWSGITYDNVDKGFRASHCDIVTAVQPGKLTILGGNVGHTVGQNTIGINSSGLVTTPRYYSVVRVGA